MKRVIIKPDTLKIEEVSIVEKYPMDGLLIGLLCYIDLLAIGTLIFRLIAGRE